MPFTALSIKESLKLIRSRIDAAARRSERSPEAVRLVAVSKTVPASRVSEAISGGQLLFGENYVQSAAEKIAQVDALQPGRGEFHLIGALQRNKVKQAVGLFSLIQTVDRLSLAKEISRHAIAAGKRQAVLMQVNISAEASKAGVSPEQASELAEAMIALSGLDLRGIMSIGTWYDESTPDAERRSEFVRMRELQQLLAGRLGVPLAELSMGMSGDFELAVEEGATLIRVGRAVFGERPGA